MDPQLRAIKTIDRNLAVTAGAGTGKTKVLTERFVNILENGDLEYDKEVESIVAITFTKKATEEMIERIRGLIKDNFDKGEKWRKYYRDMEKANISTIHSFCGNILRENPVEAGIDPLFEIIEDYSANELLDDSIAEVLSHYLEEKPNFYDLVLNFKANRLSKLYGDFKDLYRSVRTVGLSFDQVKELSLNNLDNLSIKEEDIEEVKENMLYLMSKARRNSKVYKFQENEVWLNFKRDKYKDEDELFSYLETIKENLGTSKTEAARIEKLTFLINKLLMAKDRAYRSYFELVLDAMVEIDKAYSRKKEKIGALDYDDLQIKVLNLLDNKRILRKYQGKYKYIMIDEFQDTNELQKKIFYKLSSKDYPLDRENLFVVGDPKQSIYAFRGADIDVFYDVIDDMTIDSKDNVISLETNYRSLDTLLNFVNNVFGGLMGDKYQSLRAHNKSKNKIDVEILENEDNMETEFEADLIAKRIKLLVDNGEFQYKDIGILFRATTRIYYYEEALKRYGIPFYNTSSKRFFYRSQVLDIINGLKAISNPFDSVSMVGFLRGPMIGLSDDTVFKILACGEENIYKAMKIVAENDIGNNERLKLSNAIEVLKYFYSIRDSSTVSNIVNQLVKKSNFMELQFLDEDSKQSLSNIYKFIYIAEEFDQMNNKSLESFINYIEKIRLEDSSEAVISSDNAVNLLTIHKSKGLQFPLVIIPELSKDSPNRHSRFLFNKDIGLGIKFDDSAGIYDHIKSLENEKLNEEKKRIMYVAMTRAEKKLILGNIGKNSGYKKMLMDYLNVEEYESISSIDLDFDKGIRSLKLLDVSNEGSIKIDNYPILSGENDYSLYMKNRFNISQFLTYKECKRKFYFKHINSLEMPKDYEENDSQPDILISGIDKGNIIHKFSQLYDGTMDDKPLLENIVTSYGLEFNDLIFNELKPYLVNYKNYYSRQYKEVYLEKDFSIKLDNYYMTGTIDRINISDDGIEVVDLKTNRLKNIDNLVEIYSPQLRFYSYVAGILFREKIHKATILFLENGQEVSVDISKDRVDDTISQLKEFFSFVNKNRTMDLYDKSQDCIRCEFNNFCNLIELS